MRFARTIAGDGPPDFHAFQCDLCGVAVSGEAVAGALELVRVGRQWPEPLFAAQAVTPNSSRPRQLMVPKSKCCEVRDLVAIRWERTQPGPRRSVAD